MKNIFAQVLSHGIEYIQVRDGLVSDCRNCCFYEEMTGHCDKPKTMNCNGGFHWEFSDNVQRLIKCMEG